MKYERFLLELDKRYKKEPGPHREDMYDLIKSLSEDNLDILWELIVNTYTYQRPPRRADLHKLMREHAIKGRNEQKYVYWYVCVECKAAYNLDSRACPRCKNTDRQLTYGEQLPTLIWAHENCYTCKRYQEQAYCKDWGTEDSGQQDACKACSCKECCRAERLSKYNYPLYRQILEENRKSAEIDYANLARSKKHGNT